MKNKELAKADFLDVIQASWTFARMTGEERERAAAAIRDARPRGDYIARHEYLNDVYRGFLLGLGYSGPNWRDKADEAENKPKF